MRRSFIIATIASLAGISFATSARAQEQPIPADDGPATVAPKSDPPPPRTFAEDHPLQLRSGVGYQQGKDEDVTYRRGYVSLGVGYELTPRIETYLDLRWGSTALSYRGQLDDGLKLESTLWARLDLSAAVGVRGILMQRGPWTLDMGGEFESSIITSSPTVEDLHVTTAQGRFDVAPYAAKQAEYAVRWYRGEVTTNLRLRVGPLEPRLGVGFEFLRSTLDVQLTPDSRDTLTVLGHDSRILEAPHALLMAHVSLSAGVDVRVTRHDVIDVSGLLVPSAGGVDAFGAALMLKHRF